MENVTTHAKNGYVLTTVQERALLDLFRAQWNATDSIPQVLADLWDDFSKREEPRKRDEVA